MGNFMSQLKWPLSHIDDRSFGGYRVLFVMAAEAEYGVHLQSMIQPLFLGIGPVEAAVGMGVALQGLSYESKLPDLVVSLGSAGSRNLPLAQVFQVSSVSWRDIDASVLGFPKGITPLLDLPAEITLPTPLKNLPVARLSTGSNIVSGQGYETIDAEMVDMETFAILRACQQFSVQLVGLRGISDGKEDLERYTDWTRLLPRIDENLADALKQLENVLATGWIKSCKER